MTATARKPGIFVSHATADRQAALSLADWLSLLFDAKVFVASIGAGEEWRREIFQSLRTCSVGIVLGTVNSVQRFWVHAEIGAL